MTTAANLTRAQQHSCSSIIRDAATSPRLYIYLAAVLGAVAISCFLGKELLWDTLDYHFYAGFTALHDRFGQDYFAAGGQSYFNPYVYAPFYLLVRSGMPALAIASLVAVVQSGILWLTYELAILVAPPEQPRARIAVGVLAAALALANPILINQIGTSYTDCLTAEAVLAGWLLLIAAVREPGTWRVMFAGLTLGAVSALKMTNSVHAVAAGILILFLPSPWRVRARYVGIFALALAVSFVIVAAPWAARLQAHFGNPFFPLFNDLFRSPQFTFAPVRDYRFVPDSLRDFLRRPFAIVLPLKNVDDEFSAPDLRYALLCVIAVALLLRVAYRRFIQRSRQGADTARAPAGRALAALGSGFVVDWLLWLTASGNGRYFISMACVAAVLGVCLVFVLFPTRPKVRWYLLSAILCAQIFQLCAGATYRPHVPWNGGQWFQVSMPRDLANTPALYFAFGLESNSFIVPYLPDGAGFVNLEGDYVLGPSGANGAHVESLIRKYSPNLRVIALKGHFAEPEIPGLSHMNDTLSQFGLRVDANACATIVLRNMDASRIRVNLAQLNGKQIEVPVSPDFHLVSCKVVAGSVDHVKLDLGKRSADLVFGRVEDACPALFQPHRPVTEVYGKPDGYYWVRRYPSTGLEVVVTHGAVKFADPLRGGWPGYLGQERAWERAPLRIVCGRARDRYYGRVLPSQR